MQETKQKWAEIQLTEQQAIQFGESEVWKTWTPEQVVRFQLFQRKICLDFSHFMMCLRIVLDLPVYTHELCNMDYLKEEYLGVKSAPTFGEIINLIPQEKRIIIGL